jgi:Ca2+-transporting ATPase
MWHSLSIEKIFQELKTNEKGLSFDEVIKRQKKYGQNKLPEEKRLTSLVIFLDQFKNPLILILIIAAFIALFLKEFIDFGVILVAVLINVIIGFLEENKSEKTLKQLTRMVKYYAKTIRQGEEHLIESEDLVPGDIIIVEAGDIVPADARIIFSHNLQVVEAILTGESLPSNKKAGILKEGTILADQENMLFMGTMVTRGKAKAVVVATGLKTEIGKIATLIQETGETKTPLQKKMTHLARLIGIIIAGLCLILFIIGLLIGRPFFEMLLVSVAVAVAGIPEGLVIAVTVCLAIGMQRILKRKAIVRKLVAAETLGSTTVIATDKTGTLTEGKMSIAHILPINEELKEEILKICLLCNNAIIENSHNELKEWIIHGDTTEVALILGAVQAGLDREEILKNYPRLDEIPFESEKMYMATLHEIRNLKSVLRLSLRTPCACRTGEIRNIIFVKGAPEKILSFCHLSSEENYKIKEEVKKLTSKGLRVLAFAQKEVEFQKKSLFDEDLNEMKYLGLIALKDPLRPEAKQTIFECYEAGIRPIIVTGDHRLTAEIIGREIGLIKDKNILEAKDLDKISDQELRQIVKKIDIFARVEPKHKIRIVNALKENQEVVAMTGDGVNDAPAIKAADIGIALGSGSEVTKQAADIVLLDDNFKTIIETVKEGRIIFDNIKKIIVYFFCSNFVEVILIGSSIIFDWPLPVLAAQILWVNIIEDALPAMALAYEKGEPDILKSKPRGHSTSIFDSEMKFLVFVVGILTDLILLGLFWYLFRYTHYTLNQIRTIIFVGLGIDSLFFIYSCKSLKRNLWQYNLFDNKFLNLSVISGLLMFLVAIYLPFFQKFLRTVPIGFSEWLMLICLGLINIILIELGKAIFIISQKKKL